MISKEHIFNINFHFHISLDDKESPKHIYHPHICKLHPKSISSSRTIVTTYWKSEEETWFPNTRVANQEEFKKVVTKTKILLTLKFQTPSTVKIPPYSTIPQI